jgi:peroxiredoxin
MRSFTVLFASVILSFSVLTAGELSGRRAPGFALPDLQLKYHDLADYRGKVVLVDVMRTGCPNCIQLTKQLERVKAKYGNQVMVLSVVNPPDNQQTVTQYIAEQKVTSPILFDCGQMAASYLKVTPQKPSIHVPHLFLIDGQGMIRNDFEHSPETKSIFEGDGLMQEIDKLLTAPAKKK